MIMNNLSYSDVIKIPDYGDRLRAISLSGSHHDSPRYLSNSFYKSRVWMQLRDSIITRDIGCDLAVPGMFINGKIIVHHISPLTAEDIENQTSKCYDPENLICVSEDTHNKIHYLSKFDTYVERKPGDTKLW